MGFAAIGMLFSGVATGLQMYSQHQQGETAERVAEYNNQLAVREASNQEAQTAEGIKRERINQRAALATLKARMATSGQSLTSGTPLLLAGETASRFQLGISDAARSSAMQAAAMRQQGIMGLWEGKQAKQAATTAMIGTGIQGITSAVSAYQKNTYTGAFGHNRF